MLPDDFSRHLHIAVVLALAFLLALGLVGVCGGCVLTDQMAEGWLVMRHYQKVRERDRERKRVQEPNLPLTK